MKHSALTALSLLFLFLSANGQADNRPKEGPGFYFNSFQSYKSKNVDSALYFLRLLADPKYATMLQSLLHDSFAQGFQKMWEREVKNESQKIELKKRVEAEYAILDRMMSDNNQELVKSATPIYYWTQVQQNENDSRKLTDLTNKFITTQLSPGDIYENRIGRYSLLIYQVISQKNELKDLAEKLFKNTVSKLETNQVNINVDSASRLILEKRTWYRYLYAYSNYIKANQLLKQGNNKEAAGYLKTAFDYSPDLTDKNNSSAYFYDMYFLLEKEKPTFQDDYLNYLIKNSGDKKQTLTALLTIALANPEYISQLKSFYNTNYPGNEDFNSFWIKRVNESLKKAPNFSLKYVNGSTVSTANIKGKWTLIDFWGTWCVPCREEHPDLQKFYQYVAAKHPDNFAVITVACRNEESDVTSYMKQYNYSFPVAMADNTIEKAYSIKGYPSKILITPQGNYLTVPFNVDWVKFIKKYADL